MHRLRLVKFFSDESQSTHHRASQDLMKTILQIKFPLSTSLLSGITIALCIITSEKKAYDFLEDFFRSFLKRYITQSKVIIQVLLFNVINFDGFIN